MKLSKPVIIGIAGGTASGKTTIANLLCADFKDSNSVTIISEDSYYKDQTNIPFEERGKVNYDHPLAFDFDLLFSQIKDLSNGNKINIPIYDYTIHNRSKVTKEILPSDVIILEGLFTLYNPEIREIEDIKIFVEADDDIRFIRRLSRDIVERKRTMESVINQYLTTVKPMHDTFIEPTKKYADVIIPNDRNNLVAIDLLRTKINSIISQKML